MSKLFLLALLPFFILFGDGAEQSDPKPDGVQGETGRRQKMIVTSGQVAMDVNLSKPKGQSVSRTESLRFEVKNDSFFTIVVFNDELRGPYPGSMELIPQNSLDLPAKLKASHRQLIVENTAWGGAYELIVRDAKTGFIFFNIDGAEFAYDAGGRMLSIQNGRMLLSKEFADELGRSAEAGAVAGNISITANMRPIEITEVVDGAVRSDVMVPVKRPDVGTVPGPDVIVGDLFGLGQFGIASGNRVGLAVGTDSCNAGTVDLNWFALPSNDHPVIPQNLYRMSGGSGNDERFEQIGQSNVKHAFQALTEDICGFGCNGVGDTHLGSGCSDPYTASLNAGGNNALGSRAWINPFNGTYPRGDSPTPPNAHAGHVHTGPSHRILTEINDLNTTMNPGATYYAEAQYITPHEYQWCQTHPGQCNMNNNVSYRRFTVQGTGSPFTFVAAAETQRTKSAINAWTGATVVEIKPDAANDGVGAIAYKVTNPSPGVWHYEYAVHNQNLDRAIRSLEIPLGRAATLTNVGFHAPPQHPGWTADGTVGNAGFSEAPWTANQSADSITWSAETLAQNPNANAIRWGTMYNFRFDSNLAPQTVSATVGFLKTGAPVTVQIKGPGPGPTPTPTPTPLEGDIVDAAGGPGGDGKVFANDVTVISQMVLGNLPLPVGTQFQRADVNEPCGNGMIDPGDVTTIAQYNLGNIPPRVACGVTVPAIVQLVEASMGFGPE